MLTKSRVVQLLVMLVILVTLFIWRTITTEPEKVANIDFVPSKPLTAQVACDYAKPCELVRDDRSFWLSVDNPPIKAEQWINFKLKAKAQEWRVIDAKIVGKEMFMGRIPVTFTKVENGLFAAKTLVGSCTHDTMIWQLQINIEVNGIEDLLLFDFIIQK